MTEMQVNQDEPGPRVLRGTELDLAPELPGIYAWYPRFGLHENDSKVRLDSQGTDMATTDIVKKLRQFTQYYATPTVELRGRGTYDLNWYGNVWRDTISNPVNEGDDVRLESRMAPTLKDSDDRRALIQTLAHATPVFASPLYIGVARDLRTRLANHREDYERAIAAFTLTGGPTEGARFHATHFGERLAAAGVKLDSVDCWILAIEVGQSQNNSVRRTAEAAEWLLQRTFQPTMGKR